MPQDPRLVIGNQVHALARHVTHESHAKRLFGSNWKTKLVTGTFLPPTWGRLGCHVTGSMFFGDITGGQTNQLIVQLA